MAVLRTLIGQALRATRLRQDRTLREVSTAARVSLGYLSEVERGQKEASSELLASICRALGVRLSDVLREVSESLSALEPELATGPVAVPPLAEQFAGGRLDREQLAGGQHTGAERQAEPVALAPRAGVSGPVVAAA